VFTKDISPVMFIISNLVKIGMMNIDKFKEQKLILLTSGEKEKSVFEEQHHTNSKLLTVLPLKSNVKDSALRKTLKEPIPNTVHYHYGKY
jgi:hypothetical protein